MRIDILSLFPQYFVSPFLQSMIARARKKKIIEIGLVDIRCFVRDKHKRVDDRPYGGGAGMVLQAEPVADAIRSVREEGSHVVYLTPQGEPFTTEKAQSLAKRSHLILLCGHYEGVDQRVIEGYVDEEISIGDYILSNGCVAALVVFDAVARFVPGVLGNPESLVTDSFSYEGGFGPPLYTRPEVFEGRSVPKELLSGNHRQIEQFQQQAAREKTAKVRPDLVARKER